MKYLFLLIGTIFLIVGTIGIVLPLIPTTPFLILAAGCYARSSEKLFTWINENRIFGNYIKNYREGKGIPLNIKIAAVTMLFASILYSVIFTDTRWLIKLALILIGVGVSNHIIRLKTLHSVN